MAAGRSEAVAAGLQLNEESALLTIYYANQKEPVTVGTSDGTDEGGPLPGMSEAVWKAAAGLGEPIGTLMDFLRGTFERYMKDIPADEIRIMVTVPKLEPLLTQRIPQALVSLGLQRKNIYLQDYLNSFYYYSVNRRRDMWNGDVALLCYEHEVITGYVMHIDWSKMPALVVVEKGASQAVGERERDGRGDEDWKKEKDRLFYELLGRLFDRRNVVTSYLVGDFFSQDWAEKSFRFLCTRKHAFQGRNLFTKGACYAAMERAGMLRMPGDLLFVGEDVVRENLGMQMRIRGRETYYPLVTAGVNWYEAHHECEFIPDEETSIPIVTNPMTGGAEVTHILRLSHLPKRPNRTTRLKMTVYFTSPTCCEVEVEDMGFGGLQRATHQKWKRQILF